MNEQNQNEFYRDTWAEIDLTALYHNVKKIRERFSDETSMFAAVKGNAYGHGDYEVAKVALQAGANGLVVALLDEALTLRKKGIDAPILVLGAIRPTDAGIAARHRISVPAFRMDWLEEAGEWIPQGEVLHVHIKCDTGMGRIGLKTIDELKQIEQLIAKSDKFFIEGIFTHFATADHRDDHFYNEQLKKFQAFVAHLKKAPRYVHAANSAGALCHNDSLFNAVRVGIGIYGLSPSEERKTNFQGEEVFSLHSKIVHVKKIQKGETIGYGASYRAKEEEWIATVPIGYADGWLRKLEGQPVLVGGEKAVIVGRICMDQTMIKLPYYMPVGEKVTLIGRQASHHISVEDIAKKLGTINYEVVCTINFRVPRMYTCNQKRLSN